MLFGSIWPASFNFPSNFWSRKPDRTSNFLSGSVWHDFVWLSGPCCKKTHTSNRITVVSEQTCANSEKMLQEEMARNPEAAVARQQVLCL